ncbi:MAG: OmpA family protein [Methylophilaceae bacterium]
MYKFSTSVSMLVISFLLSACQSSTTLILLPDSNGKVGAITVKSNDEVRIVDEAYHTVSTNKLTDGLTATSSLDKELVNQEYAELMKAEPAGAASFLLYFATGSTALVPDSINMIPQIVDKIKQNTPTEISIIGHTDTKGSDAINNKLSKKRAIAVESLLKEKLPTLSNVTIQSFGSKDLLIQTPPDVDELRNRRVEILIP